MNRILSFANNPKLDRHENPNSASVKKNIPANKNIRHWAIRAKVLHTKAILESCDIISNVVEKETADHYHMD